MLHLQVTSSLMPIKSFATRFSPIILACCLLSCHSKNYVAIPKDIIPPDSMVVILAEAHVIQAAALQGYSQNSKDTTIDMAYKTMWEKHHITDSTYTQSIRFYCNNARLLDSIYEKVLTNLNQQKIELMGAKHSPGK